MVRLFAYFAYLSVILGCLLLFLEPEFLDSYPEIMIVLMATIFVSTALRYYFGITKSPIITTRARVLKKKGGPSLAVKFEMPNKKILILNTGTWANFNSINTGDIVDLEYQGWEIRSMKKINTKPNISSGSKLKN